MTIGKRQSKTATPDGPRGLQCSFCSKYQREVAMLIAGPEVYICDECVAICNDVIAEKYAEPKSKSSGSGVPKRPRHK